MPDFRERYELPDGMFRKRIPAFEEAVVRELLVNAFVHRPYTQRGDIFLNLHPDRLEVVNPGRLPLGVTPQNILHASRRRNDALARIFHDLGLMEREGSGFDLMYERLLVTGRAAPRVSEGPDSVHVVVSRRVVQPGVVRLITDAEERYQLTQREKIALGLLAQTEGLSAQELTDRLEIDDARSWIERLLEVGLVEQTGRTKATRYFVPPALLRAAGLDGRTTLKRMEPHRLRALVLEDLRRYPIRHAWTSTGGSRPRSTARPSRVRSKRSSARDWSKQKGCGAGAATVSRPLKDKSHDHRPRAAERARSARFFQPISQGQDAAFVLEMSAGCP